LEKSLGFGGFFVGLLHFLRSFAMSILDRLTDDGLKALVEVKDVEIAHLQDRIKFLEEERARLERWGKAKSRRIMTLTLDVAELKKGVASDR
jgi:predicted nuclease with TOPRIM domain